MSSFNPQEINLPQDSETQISNTYIPVISAAKLSGYNIQYLRRLLRAGELENIKIGQIWLIKKSSLERYLARTKGTRDHRFGPRKPTDSESSIS